MDKAKKNCKPMIKRILTPVEVTQLFDNDIVKRLIAPDQTTYEISEIEINKSNYIFHQHGKVEKLVFNSSHISEDIYELNNVIYFRVAGSGVWKLIESVKAFNFSPNEEKILEPNEVLECRTRANEIETFINGRLGLDKYSKIKVNVIFRANIVFEEEEYLKNSESLIDPINTFSYYFEMIITNRNMSLHTVYAKPIYLCLDVTNEESMISLTTELLGNLLPKEQRSHLFF